MVLLCNWVNFEFHVNFQGSMSTELEHRILEKLLQQKKIVIDFMIPNKNCCGFSWNLSISLNGRGWGIIGWNLSVRWKDLRNLVVEGSEVQVLTKVVGPSPRGIFFEVQKSLGLFNKNMFQLIFIILFFGSNDGFSKQIYI